DIALIEVEQLEQEARRQTQSISEARQSQAEAVAGLLAAIGWVAGSAPTPEGGLDAGLDDSLPPAPPLLPQLEVAIADSVIGAAQVRLARRSALPIPNVTLGADWDDPGAPGKTLSVIGLSMPLPLWHRNGGEIAAAEAAAARAAAQLAEARLTSARLVAETRIRFEEAAGRARFARDSLLPAARRLRARAVQAYQAGETGVLPVLEALRSEREVSLAAVRDLILFQEARAMWLALLGRVQ
ncbi:MAG: TolC family protein, partial [Gemmatimonadota bacterium]